MAGITLQNFQCYSSTRFRVGQSVMMMFKVISTGGCHNMQLMAWKFKLASGGSQSAMKFVARILHVILLKRGFQTTFIERTVMGNQRQPGNLIFYLIPYLRKLWLTVRILSCESMHLKKWDLAGSVESMPFPPGHSRQSPSEY